MKQDKGEKIFVMTMLILFSPFVLLGFLFDVSLILLSRFLVKIGHEWRQAENFDGESYRDGYCLVCSPTLCIVNYRKETGEAEFIKLFERK